MCKLTSDHYTEADNSGCFYHGHCSSCTDGHMLQQYVAIFGMHLQQDSGTTCKLYVLHALDQSSCSGTHDM